MQVILREDVEFVGKRGEVVHVTPGYARNYLLRRKLAMPATPGNLKTFELQKEALALREQNDKSDAEVVASELQKWEGVVSRKAGESGALFGSVTSANVCDLLGTKRIVIDRRRIQLREPIKMLGRYSISIRLHHEVTAEFPLYVVGDTQRDSEGLRERQAAPPPEAPKEGASGTTVEEASAEATTSRTAAETPAATTGRKRAPRKKKEPAE